MSGQALINPAVLLQFARHWPAIVPMPNANTVMVAHNAFDEDRARA
jgi:hypothetical protein